MIERCARNDKQSPECESHPLRPAIIHIQVRSRTAGARVMMQCLQKKENSRQLQQVALDDVCSFVIDIC